MVQPVTYSKAGDSNYHLKLLPCCQIRDATLIKSFVESIFSVLPIISYCTLLHVL